MNGPSASDLLVSALAESLASALTKQFLPELKQHLADVVASVASDSAADTRVRPEVWLSTSDAATLVHVERKTVANWIRSGKLPASKPAGTRRYLVRQADLEVFLSAEAPSKQGRSQAAEARTLRALGL